MEESAKDGMVLSLKWQVFVILFLQQYLFGTTSLLCKKVKM